MPRLPGGHNGGRRWVGGYREWLCPPAHAASVGPSLAGPLCGSSMEYLGIEFAVRARLGRNTWAVTILPKNRGPITLNFFGTRDQAIAAAHQRISRWLTDSPTPLPESPQR